MIEADPDLPASLAARPATKRAVAAREATAATSAGSSARSSPRGAGQGRRRPERYALASPLLPRRHRRPRRDLRVGLGGAAPHRDRDARRSPPRSPAAAPRRRGRRGARRRPGPHASQGKEAFRDWMQELADRTIAELDGTPLRHPGAGPADRVLHRPHQRRRHLLHRPERGLQPARAGCGGRSRRAIDELRHLARGHHRLPRGRARPPPAGRPDRLPHRPAQPLAAPDVLGAPATARAGRCTPSG